jgi:hypothetical protein
MEKKAPGRPKLYDSTSEKLDAFRKRLETAGFMRKELLVTKETWDQVADLAKENGVSASDAASGLLEYGIKAFNAKKASSQISFSLKQSTSDQQPPALPTKPRSKPSANPIANFFVKRKESVQSVSDDDSGLKNEK